MKNVKNLFSVFSLFLGLFMQLSAQKGSDSSLPLLSTQTIKTVEVVRETPLPPKYTSQSELNITDIGKDRKVFWCHGHGGGIGSWSRVSAATQNLQNPPVLNYPPRKITSHNLDYSGSPHSVSSACSMIKTSIETISATQSIDEKKRNVVVAHSLGSLVSQYADYLYDTEGSPEDRSFYGLVTVGGPSQGAVLAKNIYPFPGSMGEDFALNAASKLTAGPVREAVENNFLLDLIWSGNAAQKKVKEFTDQWLTDAALVMLKGFNTTAALDLYPNSSMVNTIQGFTPSITRRVAFYGKLSNQDIIWKTYHYMQNSPNAEAPFAADNAQQSINKMNENKAKYKGKVDYWQGRVNYWQNKLPWCFLSPVSCLFINNKIKEAKDLRDDWKKGYYWWENANDEWRNLSGDLTFTNVPNGQCTCTDYNVLTGQTTGPYTFQGSDCFNQPSHPVYRQCTFESAFILQDVDTDGVVPVSSQVALPAALKVVEMDGDSHFQEVNSPRLKTALNRLWDGNHNEYFKTDPR